MPSNVRIAEIYDICEYGCFDINNVFYCSFRNEKTLDMLVSNQSIKKYSYCPKTYGNDGAICFRVRTI